MIDTSVIQSIQHLHGGKFIKKKLNINIKKKRGGGDSFETSVLYLVEEIPYC